VNRRMAYNHYFGTKAAPAKKAWRALSRKKHHPAGCGWCFFWLDPALQRRDALTPPAAAFP